PTTAPLAIQVRLIPDLDGVHPADHRARAVARHERRDEVGVVLIVVRRPRDGPVGPGPLRRPIEAGDDLEAGRACRLDRPVGLGPIVRALELLLDAGPWKEHPDPAEP